MFSVFVRATACFILFSSWLTTVADDELFPEQSEIDGLTAGNKPEGVVFLVMEDDEEALRWVLPRVLHYTRQLRAKWQHLPIVVLSHGNEMFALVTDQQPLYKKVHADVKKLVSDYHVAFQVCAAYASMSDVSSSEFPPYVDVVPFAPAEIENYRQMEFSMVSLELTW